MSKYTESLMVMLGREPQKPVNITEAAQQIHELKSGEKVDWVAHKEHARAHRAQGQPWRNRRWAFLIVINLLFTVSFWLDIQMLEGALTASRLLGFHLIDFNSALQVILAHKHIIINLIIGTGTVVVLWFLFGGRTFCSWVCPYHLLAEFAEKLHLYLANKKLIIDHVIHRGVRTLLWFLFAALAWFTGYTVFETISPTGILSRALIYGPGLALAWVALLLAFEIFYSRRGWCRYVCPIGLTYGFVGVFSPLRIKYDLNHCFHEGDCRKVCEVPHVLEIVKKGRASDVILDTGADCTRCGACVDICPSGALKFDVKGLSKLM